VQRLRRELAQVSIYITKWCVVASLVGVGGGLGALALRRGIAMVSGATLALPLGLSPALGACIAVLIYLWDPEAAGFGTDRYLTAVNLRYGHLERKTAISKLAASVATLGFRGSGGIEGPMALVGGSVANTIDRFPWIRRFFTVHDRRILTVCGAAGAIGAAFHSPLAGGIFAVEVLYKSSLHYADLFPAMLSATMGFVVYSLLDSGDPLLTIPHYVPNPAFTPYFFLAALVAAGAAMLFMKTFQFSVRTVRSLPFRRCTPILGGLATGAIIATVPESGGIGMEVIQDLVFTTHPLGWLALLGLAKIAATSFTVGFGGSGGLVIPALFLGALSGNAVGGFVAAGDTGLLASLVISGMSAALASVASVPITAAILLVEMAGLRLAVPATIGSVIGYIAGRGTVIYGIAVQSAPAFSRGHTMRELDRTLEE